MTIGDIIREHRREHHMTQEDLAKAVNVTGATVSRWENSEIRKMGTESKKKLSEVLDIDMALFLFPNEVLFPGEFTLLDAYRRADDGTKAAVRKLLDIEE